MCIVQTVDPMVQRQHFLKINLCVFRCKQRDNNNWECFVFSMFVPFKAKIQNNISSKQQLFITLSRSFLNAISLRRQSNHDDFDGPIYVSLGRPYRLKSFLFHLYYNFTFPLFPTSLSFCICKHGNRIKNVVCT